MQILLACAKIMNAQTDTQVPCTSRPRFEAEAERFALEVSQWDMEEVRSTLNCSPQLATENLLRYQSFREEDEKMPAILTYFGQAYKHLKAAEFSADDFRFAQEHLFITSFLYGLLRPLDRIHPYRMEGKVKLEATEERTMFDFWKPRLTEELIRAVQSDDGVLVHLATKEMEHLFDWKRVKKEVHVIQPTFYIEKNGRMVSPAMYAKSCRGAMTREIIKQARDLRQLVSEGESVEAFLQRIQDDLDIQL